MTEHVGKTVITRVALWKHARRVDDVTWLVPSSPGSKSLFCYPSHPTLWRPEYGSYMIEGTPGQPYGGTMSEFNTVEDNMDKRRREASAALKPNETLCTVTAFPR